MNKLSTFASLAKSPYMILKHRIGYLHIILIFLPMVQLESLKAFRRYGLQLYNISSPKAQSQVLVLEVGRLYADCEKSVDCGRADE